MHGLVRCKHERRCSRAGGGCVIHRCQNKNPRNFGIWENAMSWVPTSERESRDSELGEARRICALRAPSVGWVESWRCKSSQHRKIVFLSPHIEKPLNSKRWIKVSYLNQFRVFVFLYMFMNILWTMCLFHTSVSWVCYNYALKLNCRQTIVYAYNHETVCEYTPDVKLLTLERNT